MTETDNMSYQQATDGIEDPNRTAERLFQIHGLQEELTSSPYSHDILELALATATSLPVFEQDESGLVWMLIVGRPASDKTQTVL